MPITTLRCRPDEPRALRVVVALRYETEPASSQRDVEVIARRTRLVLGRFGPLLRHARVELSREGDGAACRLELHRPSAPPIVVIARGAAPMPVFAQAIEEAVQELAARLRRGRALVLRADP